MNEHRAGKVTRSESLRDVVEVRADRIDALLIHRVSCLGDDQASFACQNEVMNRLRVRETHAFVSASAYRL
jgi:hypothetical protein